MATPVAAATTLTMTASATHIACGSSAFVTVHVNSGYGSLYVPDGTQVTLSTTGGTLSSTTGTTAGWQRPGDVPGPGDQGCGDHLRGVR